MLQRLLLDRASPGGAKAALSVLIFHRVLLAPDPLFPEVPTAHDFDRICRWMRAWCNVLPLDEAILRLAARTLPARALAITFDDGYADNHAVALPILQRHGLPATFFIATGFLDGGRMWNDTVIEALRAAPGDVLNLDDIVPVALGTLPMSTTSQRRQAVDSVIRTVRYLPARHRLEVVSRIARVARKALPDDLMMTRGQVVDLHRANMQIGAHTVSHPILATLDDGEARSEMGQSKAFLEDLVQGDVRLFAYPNGRPGDDYTARSAAIAREVGFEAAVSTAWGAANTSTDPFEIPRYMPWDRSRLRFGVRLAVTAWTGRRHGASANAQEHA